MTRLFYVIKSVTKPKFVSHQKLECGKLQWQFTRLFQRGFATKQCPNDDSQTPGKKDRGNDLQLNLTDGQQFNQNESITAHKNIHNATNDAQHGANGLDDNTKISGASGGSTGIFGYLLNQGYGRLVWYRHKKEKCWQWKYSGKLFQICAIIGAAFVFYKHQPKVELTFCTKYPWSSVSILITFKTNIT